MRIYTSWFSNKELKKRDDLVKIRISIGKPKWPVGYEIDCYMPRLAPSWAMVKMEDQKAYRVMYRARLEEVGVEEIMASLKEISQVAGDKDIVLLCFEDLAKPGNWCHRTMAAEWLTEKTAEIIEELQPKSIETLQSALI